MHTKTGMLFGQHFDGEPPRNLNHIFLRQFENGFTKKMACLRSKAKMTEPPQPGKDSLKMSWGRATDPPPPWAEFTCLLQQLKRVNIPLQQHEDEKSALRSFRVRTLELLIPVPPHTVSVQSAVNNSFSTVNHWANITLMNIIMNIGTLSPDAYDDILSKKVG